MISNLRSSKFGVPLLALLVGVAACLVVEEARVSEVHYEDSNQSIEDMVRLSQHVVVVEAKPLDPLVAIKKHVWPKSTHYKKESETTHTELATLYKVVEVLKTAGHSMTGSPPRTIKLGNLKAYEVPAYGVADHKAYHETGMSESPVVQRYVSKDPVSDVATAGAKKILFLQDFTREVAPEFKDVFILTGEEGMKSKDAVLKVINSKSTDAYPEQIKRPKGN